MTRIGFVRRLIFGRIDRKWWAPLFALSAVLLPVALRAALSPFLAGLPFLTFFPVLLVATIVLGWRWGSAALVGSALVANYMFLPPIMAFSVGGQELTSTACFVVAGALQVSAAEALRRSVLELQERAEREAELNLELQHRVNNNLAVIQGLSRQTARHNSDPEAFHEAFNDRLLALSQANRILSSQGWEIVALPELAEAALNPFKTKGDIYLQGDPCELPARACVPLVLALHELATNAVKYGALSVATGCVRIGWSVEQGRCHLVWREERGPRVMRPTRRGLGSRLLTSQGGLGTVSLDFRPEGVACRIEIDGARALHARSSVA